jgi:septal ring factor EnvC (AmiA/AmiB activator)
MATAHPSGETTPPQRPSNGTPGTPGAAGEPTKHRSPWMWLSIGMAIVAVGLLVWGLNKQSDLDAANDDVAQLRSKADQQQDSGSAIIGVAKSAFDELKQQLGATNEDLQQTQGELDKAQQDADKAQASIDDAKQKAADAKSSAVEKADARADEAKAVADQAQAKSSIVASCAKAYVAALGKLLDGGVQQVRQDIEGVTGDCKGALSGS